jgi:uncharacterized membrane protein
MKDLHRGFEITTGAAFLVLAAIITAFLFQVHEHLGSLPLIFLAMAVFALLLPLAGGILLIHLGATSHDQG